MDKLHEEDGSAAVAADATSNSTTGIAKPIYPLGKLKRRKDLQEIVEELPTFEAFHDVHHAHDLLGHNSIGEKYHKHPQHRLFVKHDFKDKDHLKKHGAQWHGDKKQWSVKSISHSAATAKHVNVGGKKFEVTHTEPAGYAHG